MLQLRRASGLEQVWGPWALAQVWEGPHLALELRKHCVVHTCHLNPFKHPVPRQLVTKAKGRSKA